ncbi:MAG: dihydrodipicolinate synthase family protein [Fimbriimonadaceae bacterium]|nr:MAG: dihydrodipicolinate synthase family protein [Fimbriimonadaceae bacterium]
MELTWKGVMPAVTTPFLDDLSVDHAALAAHCEWLIDNGCKGIVPCGSLGEGATLRHDERIEVVRTCVKAVGQRAPVIPGVSALSTQEAVDFAIECERQGAAALMVLPPYVYQGSRTEVDDHFEALLAATALPCMLYNNPAAYGTDLRADQIKELADAHPNLVAVKESSGDARRITAIRALLGDRLAIFVGLDDMIYEGMAIGASGWVAGLVNALPRESVELFELCRRKEWGLALDLYRWFLPLLRMDTGPQFVQLIKLAQHEAGRGTEVVRPPRFPVTGPEREAALAEIRAALDTRPKV